ncbi:uncharacterized protein LOC125238271 [Leguminivora glycinivorella]|uniref:uncharacterized protein LOC125238271 n=1 Tax=Leguminivora glycinivorella TaxID=1035111 RepID=UPI00200FD713|nr:uncharacterized protein LOC125238271 [Leguminivora glycinivorella]
MGGECVVVRRARAGDAAARAQLLRDAYAALNHDAFMYFYFHEATLQAVVLVGAGLFIFLGCGLGTLAALPALAAVVVFLAVRLAHDHMASVQAARLRTEKSGWVAERRGPPTAPAPARVSVLVCEEDAAPAAGGAAALVGSVSVRASRDSAGGWLEGLAVCPRWRRRGVGRALEAAARRGAAARLRYGALHAVTSSLQPAARAILHDAGWQCTAAYARPLVGAALVLPLARLERDLMEPA